jgi:hypothetical protein
MQALILAVLVQLALAVSPCYEPVYMKCPVCSICKCAGTTVNCQGRELTQVPQGVPVGTQFLNLEENLIIELGADAFEGLANLRTINVFHNSLVTIDAQSFLPTNKTLEQLFMYDNLIKSFPVGLLAGFSSLRKLRFDKNSLLELPHDAFVDLVSLQELDFSGNLIRHIGFANRKVFQSLSKLERLEMDNIGCGAHWPGDPYSTGFTKEVSDAAGGSWRAGSINPLRNSVDRPCMWHLKSMHFCGVPSSTHILVNGAKFVRRCAPIDCSQEICPMDEEFLDSRKVTAREHPSTFVVACFMTTSAVWCVLAVMAISGSKLKSHEGSIA